MKVGQSVYFQDDARAGQVAAIGEIHFCVRMADGKPRWIANDAVCSIEATGVYLLCSRDGLDPYLP